MVILGRIIVARSMVSLVGDFLSWECSLSFSYSDLRASRRGLSFGDVQATIFEGFIYGPKAWLHIKYFVIVLKLLHYWICVLIYIC